MSAKRKLSKTTRNVSNNNVYNICCINNNTVLEIEIKTKNLFFLATIEDAHEGIAKSQRMGN
jgi:hypothetical protein